MNMKWTMLAMASGALLLNGCGDAASGGGGAVDAQAVAQIAEGLEEGGYELELSGAATSVGEYTGNGKPVLYEPAKEGDNTQGPRLVRVRIGAYHQDDDAQSASPAFITFVLPENVQTGTQALAVSRTAEEGQVTAQLIGDGYGWSFAREVEGTIELAEVGERFTAAWQFDIADGQENTVQVLGRAYGVPFSPKLEGAYTLTRDGGEAESFEGLGSWSRQGGGAEYLLMFGPEPGNSISFRIPADIEPGEHSLRLRRDDGDGVPVSLPDRVESVDGRIRIEQAGEQTHATFDLTGTGEQTLEVTGAFRHLTMSTD
ncbi:MAG: hypothetical protein WD534_06435 [Phycisphaeraceae bacterium]